MLEAEWPIFGFETDFAGTLHCIPMSVRFKLDQCGIKLSLKQWNRFAPEERRELVRRTCKTLEHIQVYRERLAKLIETRASSAVEIVATDANPEWANSERVPLRIVSYATALCVTPPSLRQWATLTPLQRFALFKLTRAGHDNDNFVPAMQEFGMGF
jgi:hypothetical protein